MPAPARSSTGCSTIGRSCCRRATCRRKPRLHPIRSRDPRLPSSTALTANAGAFSAGAAGPATTAALFASSPYARGVSRSVPIGGHCPIRRAPSGRGPITGRFVLTGVDLTAYGADLPGRPRPRVDGETASLQPCPELRAFAASLPSTRQEIDGGSVAGPAWPSRNRLIAAILHLSLAGRRRSCPKAHEAAVTPRGGGDRCCKSAPRELRPRSGARRRLDPPGFPTENEGYVPTHTPRSDRRMPG